MCARISIEFSIEQLNDVYQKIDWSKLIDNKISELQKQLSEL